MKNTVFVIIATILFASTTSAQQTGKTLLVVDIQNGLTERKDMYHMSSVIDNVNDAIKKYREKGYLVVFVQHNNKQLKNGTEKWKVDSRIDKVDNDLVVQKFRGSSFDRTDLEAILRKNNIEEIVVCGLVTHGCIKATCKGGLSLGFKTALLKNGHTNWDKKAPEKIRSVELELEQKGAKIVEIGNL